VTAFAASKAPHRLAKPTPRAQLGMAGVTLQEAFAQADEAKPAALACIARLLADFAAPRATPHPAP
jgi:hypothetical protein